MSHFALAAAVNPFFPGTPVSVRIRRDGRSVLHRNPASVLFKLGRLVPSAPEPCVCFALARTASPLLHRNPVSTCFS